jgi:hypothetical protein
MNEDFTEEEFDDELPEGVDFAEPEEKPPAPKRAAAPVKGKGIQERRKAAQQQAADEAQAERYTPFIMPKRVGVLDNETKTPLMEDKDTNTLLLGLVTKMLNDIDEIKKNI